MLKLNINFNSKYKNTIRSYLIKILPNIILAKTNKRIASINQRSLFDNLSLSIKITTILFTLSGIYFILAFNLFNTFWYHKLISIVSTFVFYYLAKETVFELIENKLKNELPSMCKKLSHYYEHYNYNLNLALKETENRVTPNSKFVLVKIRETLGKPDYDKNMITLQNEMPLSWLKMLSNILSIAKKNGGVIISENLKRMKNIIGFLNLQQGIANAELLGMELFVFFTPFVIIPVSRWYNSALLADIESIGNIYNSVQAQSIAALIFLFGNVGALFIHWIRKLQS